MLQEEGWTPPWHHCHQQLHSAATSKQHCVHYFDATSWMWPTRAFAYDLVPMSCNKMAEVMREAVKTTGNRLRALVRAMMHLVSRPTFKRNYETLNKDKFACFRGRWYSDASLCDRVTLFTDVDECKKPQSYHHCSDMCVNTPGSYYCKCKDGYLLSANGRICRGDLPLSLPSSEVHSPNLFKEKFMSDVVRIGSIIISHLSKLWKVEFFILRVLVSLQGKFDIDHSWEWKG